jgi:hypothetical protein
VITASTPSWRALFTGLSPRCFDKLVTALRSEGAAEARRGRPWGLPLEDRVLLQGRLPLERFVTETIQLTDVE